MESRQKFFKSISSQVNTSDKNTAFLIIKICQFKEINMTYGFARGDILLEHVLNKLKSILRPTDVVGRIGNNEFGLLLPALNNTSHALLAANKIISCFKDAITIGGASISPKIVVGIAVKPDHGDTLEKLLHAASLALQLAESKNEDYLLYQTSTDDEILPPGLMLENEIQTALEDGEFNLFCQPKINLASRKLYGGESLIRWNNKKYGFVNTQYFIDVLESSNSLMPVTNWVLNGALRQCVRYQEILPEFTIAVNLPPPLLIDNEIVNVISNAVGTWSVRPSSLMLEVTEGAMMTDPKKSMEILHEFHQHGFGISIDDFGTGYSSLAYLKNLPANEIKIDKSFVMNMANDKKDANIVKAAVDLAHNLDLKIVAEGVEDEKTLDLLSAIGCDYAQGYYIAKPMSYDDLVVWMKDSTWC
ncbi:MAG: EAL domain-containing protein [Gammaproteobacteria bacterium]|nr:EAL domain-containing protein [Gammaproteobacteria bacterium]